MPFKPFCGWEGSPKIDALKNPTKTDYRKSWYPYSILSTGGPRKGKQKGTCPIKYLLKEALGGLIHMSHKIRGFFQKCSESPTKRGHPPIKINRGFINPGLALTLIGPVDFNFLVEIKGFSE